MSSTEVVINEDGAIAVILRNWLNHDYAKQLHDALVHNVAWFYGDLNMYGKKIPIPRGMFFLGDSAVKTYTYNRQSSDIQSWDETGDGYLPLYGHARMIRDRILVDQEINRWFHPLIAAQMYYDSCLLNYYRDGKDSISPHSDKEALGIMNAVIGVSLGGTRNFVFRKKTKVEGERTHKSHKIQIHNGDLMIMAGRCQELWTHAVPKDNSCNESRISMTFRLLNPK